ncbi:LOW QUALITY PROTEIN: hypothetical protein HID58_044167 [Brassica napus]|uniref:Uncharacterized protein n=1 Tax=Brassica napus TaxID=3708 RepID=A0ABQ8BIQ5_BRANA|nr:LOW QUALITY PROTEIN: hypothetical protein HID58_044167 [Brassica napus]
MASQRKDRDEISSGGSINFISASLILGSGDTFYTAVASFRFRETVALTAPDFAGDRLRESEPSFLRLLLRFDLEPVLDLRFCFSFVQSTLVLNILVDFGSIVDLQRVWAPRWSFRRAFSLILAEVSVDFWWISEDCGDGGLHTGEEVGLRSFDACLSDGGSVNTWRPGDAWSLAVRILTRVPFTNLE